MISGTLFKKARKLDKDMAKMIKAGIYASRNLCYHLDKRHDRTQDVYSIETDSAAWGNKIKEFVHHSLGLLTSELYRHVRAPLCVDFSLVLPFTFSQLAFFRLRRVMSAYTDDRPYSLDLVSAVSICFFRRDPIRELIRSGERCNDRECSRTRCTI